MAYSKMVKRTFITSGETGKTSQSAQARKALAASCQKLIGIALVAHIPDQAVLLGIKDRQHGQRQFYDAKRWSKMAAIV